MISHSTVSSFLRRCEKLSVLVVGDLMLDHYIYGEVGRISPEAPVPVLTFTREENRPGGAANVALNLSRWGCRATLAGVVGADDAGELLEDLLARAGVDTHGVFDSPGRMTPVKSRLLARNQQLMRIDREQSLPLDESTEAELVSRILELLPAQDLVLVSDYAKGGVTTGVLEPLLKAASQGGIPVLVDPKGKDFTRYRGATIVTPNLNEFLTVSGLADDASCDQVRRAATDIIQSLNLEGLLVTLGERGMTWFGADGGELYSPARAREVHDVAGAGDTVLAAAGCARALGWPMEKAMSLANLAAGLVVGKPGVATVSGQELLQAAQPENKLVDPDELAEMGRYAREQGRRIVFTNGCFDLLHAGHVSYLQKARQLGDLLVLGLNTDASIRRLKGPERPVVGQADRARIMAALDCVDYVVLFDDDTPMRLIEALRPDILVKGGDYRPEDVVGREFVESYGGRLELIHFEAGKSTTAMIDKILKSFR
ncbi:MAG: bifunctional D-glycero-beta-D-manno-heptose-7-phosphate kinase/D-glycero-beta-D-manno-heptose 1-phosphate adenylyltransferase HldE [Deltaproteobacteria bacterium]|nr:MAG: bifunctional D-glycero-beta-D-manno-heptose-7-phosphate kinase/D-glycero-beta-D-manno-heptose 1-phosphate adenylyltransferase HldE [Deltaproteobacteria bacterium]